MRSIVLLLAIFICSNSIAQPKPEEMIGLIRSGKIYLNKKDVSQWMVSPFVAVLKNTNHTTGSYNKTHTYDQYGIVLFEKMRNQKPTDTIAEIQFYFSPATESNNVVPSGTYRGKFKIENLVISKDLTPAQVTSGLEDFTKTESYLENSLRFEKNDLYFYFQFTSTSDRLVKISIGRKSKP